jgi:hypothetical protein
MADDDNGDALGVVALTYFGATILALGFVLWGASDFGPKENAGRMITLIGAFAILMTATAVLVRGPFGRLSFASRGAIVAFGVLATIPAWIWIALR